MGLQTFEYFFMALKVVLQNCNGFSDKQSSIARRRGQLKRFFHPTCDRNPKASNGASKP